MPQYVFCLLVLLGNGGQKRVAAEESDHPDDHEVLDRLEHVELEPEVEVQHEDGPQTRVETCTV